MHGVIFNGFKPKICILLWMDGRLCCPVQRVKHFNANANLKQLVVGINISFILPKTKQNPKTNIPIWATDFTVTLLSVASVVQKKLLTWVPQTPAFYSPPGSLTEGIRCYSPLGLFLSIFSSLPVIQSLGWPPLHQLHHLIARRTVTFLGLTSAVLASAWRAPSGQEQLDKTPPDKPDHGVMGELTVPSRWRFCPRQEMLCTLVVGT